MATSQNVEDLSDAVTCSICLEEMKKRTPKSLPCQHTFCSQCIDKLLDNATTDKDVKTIICPTCRKPAQIPGGSSSSLPSCIYIEKLDKALEILKKDSSTCKVCQHSDFECEITRYCFECTLAMCQSCFKKHDDQFNSHKSVKVTGSTIMNLMCKEHEKPFEVFCADCCQILCQPCTIKEHSRHQISDIKSNNKEDREAIDKAFTEKEKSANEQLAKIDDMQRQFSEKMDTVEDDLNKRLATRITQVNEQHEALRLKLEERRKEYNKNLNNAKAIVQNTKNYVAMMHEQYKILRNPTTEISEGNICSTGVKVLAVEECIRNIKPLDFLPGPDKMLFGDLFEVESENAEQSEPLKMLYKIHKLTNVNNIDYLYNGMLVIADYDEGLQVYDPSGRPVQMTFTGKFKEHTTFISADKSNPLLVVSICDGVQVFTADGDNWQEKTIFSVPRKQFLVALSVSGGIILMEYDVTPYLFLKQSWSIMKYDINGKQLWSKQLQQWASDICVDNQDRIIICHKNSVTVYDQSVNELFSIPTLDKAIIPFGVCVDSQDNIILADSNNKAVLLYNSRGKNRRVLLAESKPVLRVASNKDKCIAIVSDKIVTVFESR